MDQNSNQQDTPGDKTAGDRRWKFVDRLSFLSFGFAAATFLIENTASDAIYQKSLKNSFLTKQNLILRSNLPSEQASALEDLADEYNLLSGEPSFGENNHAGKELARKVEALNDKARAILGIQSPERE